MFYEFMGGKCLSIVKWLRSNFADNWTIVMNPRNMLTQIIFRSNRFPAFARMMAFQVNCKLSSRKISRWCGVTTLVTRSLSGLMFFFWWGMLVRPGKYTDLMVQLRCRWLTTEPWLHSLKRKCLHFDEIFITGCTESCQNDNFRCSQWWNFHQNDDIFVSVLLTITGVSSACVLLYLWLFDIKYILTNAGVIYEGIVGFYFDHRQFHGRGPWLVKNP